MVRQDENEALHAYETRIKDSFARIEPVLKEVSAMQHEPDFAARAQDVARRELGVELPNHVLERSWVEPLDMKRLYAAAVFDVYRKFCDEFFMDDPLGHSQAELEEFERFLRECGFHMMDISPCADGRLAHVVRYVLRLPYRAVRRRSYAGAMFDVEDSLQKWVEVELRRFREGKPNPADEGTRYLKIVAYHYSKVDPEHGGCAAHGSDERKAAAAGLERLYAFRQAIENSYCCGASIDLLLIGVNTDNDSLRVHIPDSEGNIDLEKYVETDVIYDETSGVSAQQAAEVIGHKCKEVSPGAAEGMLKLAHRLIEGNISQIEYVRRYHNGQYEDIDHAERFIGAGIGFEEVQLRNLTYFAYMRTVEEGAPDIDVGIKIFSKLNMARGLPAPVVVRFDYHGNVPGARERAIAHCRRVAEAMMARFEELARKGLLHTLLVIRDCAAGGLVEVLESSVDRNLAVAGGR